MNAEARDNAQMRIERAIDAYIGDLARRGRSEATRRSYQRLLNNFAALLPVDADVAGITLDDYERFLDRWTNSAQSTLASGVSLVSGFSRFLKSRGWSAEHVAEPLRRPRRLRPEDVEVVSVGTEDVTKMFSACEDWQELLCVATAAYLGPRRAAIARARRADLNLAKGTIRFLEKGRKVAVKPVPDEYLAILRAAEQYGVWAGPEDYLVPNRRPASVRRRERSDKIVWETIKRVAARAGVRAHVHALRAAFAVRFDEAHPDQLIALQELMGHDCLETTKVYLRRKDKAKAMEAVRDLSWNVPSSFAREAHTGFEPVPQENRLPDILRWKLEQLRTEEFSRARR